MVNWFIFGIFALVTYGLWGFFSKLATNYIDPKSILIYGALGSLIIGIIVLSFLGFKPEIHIKGIIFGGLAGITITLGTLFFLSALSKGKVSVVVPMTALYPLITIILSFLLLNEQITIKQGIGIILAIIAMILFSI